MLKIGCLMWGSHVPSLVEASKEIDCVQLNLRSIKEMGNLEEREEFFRDLERETDLVLVYCAALNSMWESLAPKLEELKAKKRVICWGSDPSMLLCSSVSLEQVAVAQQYVAFDGPENMLNLLRYLAAEFGGIEIAFNPPREMAWQGIYGGERDFFSRLEDYLVWAKEEGRWSAERKTVGILFGRALWLNQNTEIIDTLIQSLEEKNLNVLPVFSNNFVKPEFGVESNETVLRQYFMQGEKAIINLLFNLQPFRLINRGRRPTDEEKELAVELLKELNVPVLKGIVPSLTEEEWQKSQHGLGISLTMHVAMPEFDGVIEPLIIGVRQQEKDPDTGVTVEKHLPLSDRLEHAAKRISRWLSLQSKKPPERKIVFLFNNSPCDGLEARVGGAANLDSLESVVQIMKRMQAEGYHLENVPENGKELIDTIMGRKAISDFRWTPVEEIVQKKGAIALLETEKYLEWYQHCSPAVQEKIQEVWGEPPGKAMVYQDKLVITGVEYGNVLIVVQPKRGCLGAKCDGQACKILHDPDCPPTHQYLASYWYWDKVWGADALVNVGTHGNLEFLPGKSTGLSGHCYPDLALGELPHLYLYSVDNPAEGTIAKRRSYAAVVDYLTPVMANSGVYDELQELENFLAEYGTAITTDPARAHALQDLILKSIEETKLYQELKIALENLHDLNYVEKSFPEIVKKSHEVLTRLRDTSIADGLHILGQPPQGEKMVEFIACLLKYDFEESISLRRVILELMGLDYEIVVNQPGELVEIYQKTNGELLEEAYQLSKDFIAVFLGNQDTNYLSLAQSILGQKLKYTAPLAKLEEIENKVKDLQQKIISCSQEMDNLLLALDGGYIPSGASGCPTRGRPDVLPTGRNLYSMDPYAVPTKGAWKVGKVLAQRLLEKYLAEEGCYPENCGMLLFGGDMMGTNGEQTSQILYLLGVEPVWAPNGRVKDVRVLSLEELNRPRIDVTVRISSIARDCFPMVAELLDKAVKKVAALDESLEDNYVRKNTLANMEQLKAGGSEASEEQLWQQGVSRIFGSKPGTYGSGVNLAVAASAWKEEKDLAEIFVSWGGYAYGEDKYGEEAHEQFVSQLKTLKMTFRNLGTDEKDLFNCHCPFSYQGGLAAAAKVISGQKVKNYYGDTRDPQRPQVVDLADEIRRVVRTKVLNPKWIAGMKRHGYKGASDMAKKIGSVYGWEATTQEVDDWIFDDITETYVLNEENRHFFEEHNPWALEEVSRRLLEAQQRGLWQANPEILQKLQETYLEIEGWMEERMGDVEGEFQGGEVNVMNTDDVEEWEAKMRNIRQKMYGK